MPPSVVFTASACESFGPGLSGSLNGSAVAAVAGLAVAGAVFASPIAGAARESGAVSETTTAGFSPSRPLMTKSAGCCLVAPPDGISATARWRPGDSVTGARPAAPRAAAAGAPTVLNAASSVPSSLARTGWYWPAGHHAQASSATSPPAAAATSRPPARLTGAPAPRLAAGRADEALRHQHGADHRQREREDPHDRGQQTGQRLVGHRPDDVRAALPCRRGELREQQDRAERHAQQHRDDDEHPHGDQRAGAPGQRRRLAAPPGSRRRSVGPMCAYRSGTPVASDRMW